MCVAGPPTPPKGGSSRGGPSIAWRPSRAPRCAHTTWCRYLWLQGTGAAAHALQFPLSTCSPGHPARLQAAETYPCPPKAVGVLSESTYLPWLARWKPAKLGDPSRRPVQSGPAKVAAWSSPSGDMPRSRGLSQGPRLVARPGVNPISQPCRAGLRRLGPLRRGSTPRPRERRRSPNGGRCLCTVGTSPRAGKGRSPPRASTRHPGNVRNFGPQGHVQGRRTPAVHYPLDLNPVAPRETERVTCTPSLGPPPKGTPCPSRVHGERVH